MAVFSGEVTIKVKFKNLKVAVGYGMTSAIIKHKCVEQAYAISPGGRGDTSSMSLYAGRWWIIAFTLLNPSAPLLKIFLFIFP